MTAPVFDKKQTKPFIFFGNTRAGSSDLTDILYQRN
jgi:hypothetical protein